MATFSNYGATTVDIAAPGVNIYSTLPGDAYIPGPSDLFFEDFDPTSHAWYTGGSSNWSYTTEDSYSPTTSITDSPGTKYANNTSSLVYSGPVDLSSQTGFVYLGFKMKMDVEKSGDTISVIASNNCSSINSAWYYLAKYSGENHPWESYSVAVPLEFRSTDFCFGFYLETDSQNVFDGVHIDDVGIGAVNTTASASYGYMDGTSMATPAVTGAVALLASVYPSETVADLRSRILLRADKRASLSNKVASGGRLNLNNAIQAEWSVNSGSSGGGLFPVFDKLNLLLTVFGFLAIGGLIARRRLQLDKDN